MIKILFTFCLCLLESVPFTLNRSVHSFEHRLDSRKSIKYSNIVQYLYCKKERASGFFRSNVKVKSTIDHLPLREL